MKKAIASWTIKLHADCPHCEEFNDLYEQWADHEWPFEIGSAKEEDLEGIIWICDGCEKEFELELVEF